MGLDISYYERLLPANNATQEDRDNGEVQDWYVAHPDYETLDGLDYKYVRGIGNRGHFRAGSYGGYNAWRQWLASIVHGVEPREIWNNPDKYKGQPFYELINFSDCEGVIGPKTSAKLAKDFADYQAQIDAMPDDESWFKHAYKEWRHAFETAANTGFVEFH